MIRNLIARWFPELPVLKVMPPHVRDMPIDAHALAIHMAGCQKPSVGTVTGHIKPATKDVVL